MVSLPEIFAVGLDLTKEKNNQTYYRNKIFKSSDLQMKYKQYCRNNCTKNLAAHGATSEL
jgi:hypothetical protein